MKIINRFEIPYYQSINEQSQVVDDTEPLVTDLDQLYQLYEKMVLVRTLDTKAIALQRTGKLGTYPSTRGQEAVFVGVGHAMANTDVFVPYYRDMGVLIQRGVSLSQILLFWGGDERGNCFSPDSQDFPFSVPVGSQPLHATGIAYAIKYRQEKRAVVVMCGDGATSQGDFYEALNVAGAWQLPVIFVVCNNQWAISVSRTAQTASETLAQKAIAAGFQGEQIDGNDICAVVSRMTAGLKKAREQQVPLLLEMICYRHHDHTTADDATRYEPAGWRDEEWKKEPVTRLKHFLEAKGRLDEKTEQTLREKASADVEKAVADYHAVDPQPLTAMFDDLYATLPQQLDAQRDTVVNLRSEQHG